MSASYRLRFDCFERDLDDLRVNNTIIFLMVANDAIRFLSLFEVDAHSTRMKLEDNGIRT